jgi:hypothetical protein
MLVEAPSISWPNNKTPYMFRSSHEIEYHVSLTNAPKEIMYIVLSIAKNRFGRRAEIFLQDNAYQFLFNLVYA